MKKTVSVLGIALLMGTVVVGQTSSTATRKSGKSKKSSDTSASTQSGSSAYGSQSGDTSASANSASAGAPASDSSQVKTGNSGFDDTSSSTTAVTGTTSEQSDPQAAASTGTAGQMSAMSGSGTAQTISNGPVAETVGDRTVLIGWATRDAASNTGIKYGTNRANMTEIAQGTDGSDGKNHHANLQGLQPNTRYYFQVTENGSPVGGVGTFKTTASGEAPVQSKAIIPQK